MHYSFKIQLEYRDGSRDEMSISTYQYKMVETLPEMLLRGSSAVRCIITDENDNVISKWAWKNLEKTHLYCSHSHNIKHVNI